MSDPPVEEVAPPVARPDTLLWRWLCLVVTLVGIPSLVFNLLLPTPRSMASEEGQIVVIVSVFTVAAWLALFIYFLKLYRGTWRTEPRFAIVLAALTLDAFRNTAENLYFGVSYSGWIRIIPQAIMRILWQPQVMIISRLLGLSTAIVIVWLVTERGFENLKLREQRSLELEHRNRELQALQQLSSLVSGTLEMQTVLNRVCREIVEALRFRSALLCLVDEAGGVIFGAAGYGVPQSLVDEARRSLQGDDI
ncbi:MAG: hypothetical protein LC772_12745, partial [Chloroflexi bacterium]|nr:hypothetical protein [Chloroflexota bacterium]